MAAKTAAGGQRRANSQPLASQAGVRMLLAGGDAAGAILAAAMTLTRVDSASIGIGSYAFAILWDGKRLYGLSAPERQTLVSTSLSAKRFPQEKGLMPN